LELSKASFGIDKNYRTASRPGTNLDVTEDKATGITSIIMATKLNGSPEIYLIPMMTELIQVTLIRPGFKLGALDKGFIYYQ